LTCTFEDGTLCNYQPAGTATQNFVNSKIPVNNRLTGIPKAAEGNNFASSYMKAKPEKSTLTANTNFDKDYFVHFKYHDDTDGMAIRGCCDAETTCPFDSKDQVEVKDYQTWREGSFMCKQGTQKVIFVSDNTKGINEGAGGIDDIHVHNSNNGQEGDVLQC